jgi:hypothetical protein
MTCIAEHPEWIASNPVQLAAPHRCNCAWVNPVECAFDRRLTQLLCPCLCHTRRNAEDGDGIGVPVLRGKTARPVGTAGGLR